LDIWPVWQDHSELTRDLIIGNNEKGIAACWPAMGFLTEQEAVFVVNICTGGQKTSDSSVSKLSGSQSVFIDGQVMYAQPQAVSAFLSLACILDCGRHRLPSELYLINRNISDDILYEYLKHELVQEVRIEKNAAIYIKLRLCYKYPASLGDVPQKVKSVLQQQIKHCQELIRQGGFNMPDPEFEFSQALFLDEHPFLDDQSIDDSGV